MSKKIYWKESLPSYSGMKKANLLESLHNAEEKAKYEREKRKETEKENRMLRKEIVELKKNLDGF